VLSRKRAFITNVKSKPDQFAPADPQVTGTKRKAGNIEEVERKKKKTLPVARRDVIESEHSASDSEDDVGVAYKDIVRISHPVITPPKIGKPELSQLQSIARVRAAASEEEYVAMYREASKNVAFKEYDELTDKQKLNLRKETKGTDESGRFVPKKPKFQVEFWLKDRL
jgi:hypothetical protein